MAEEGKSGVRVCVTGGAGFIGSSRQGDVWLQIDSGEAGLIRLLAGCTAAGDDGKAGLLRRLVPPGAPAERLVLFEADLYDDDSFAPAIAGCQFVFLVVTPSTRARGRRLQVVQDCGGSSRGCGARHPPAMRGIQDGGARDCVGIRRFAADRVLKRCWRDAQSLNPAGLGSTPITLSGTRSAALRYRVEAPVGEGAPELQRRQEPNLRGGHPVQRPRRGGHGPSTVAPVTGRELYFTLPRILQSLLGSVPLVHVDDICAAHIFSMEQPSLSGRFLCAAAYPTIHDVLEHYGSKCPHLDLLGETDELARVPSGRDKFGELGFRYKYKMEQILDEGIGCAVRLGGLDASRLSVHQK